MDLHGTPARVPLESSYGRLWRNTCCGLVVPPGPFRWAPRFARSVSPNLVAYERKVLLKKYGFIKVASAIFVFLLARGGTVSHAADQDDDAHYACNQLPSHAALHKALSAAQGTPNGGFGLNMWGTIVNRDGVVCAVAFTGSARGDQWPGSRAIAAQKANTANAFSLPALSLSTANLYSATQPGGTLYGLQASNPVDTKVAYRGDPADNGQSNDPMVGGRIGGVNVFGGGLALYNSQKQLIGAVGVSGDSSCADHNIAWRTRNNLKLDFVPAGVNTGDPKRPDNIVYDIVTQPGFAIGVSAGGWGHPVCSSEAAQISTQLPVVE